MPLSIKNPRAEQLAHQVAKHTGETLTNAVIHALEERLERLQGRRTGPNVVEEIMAIAHRCSKLPVQDNRSPEEILGYSNTGTFS